ncbi:unnamed protein product, partial [Heterosigma akashiwo]
VVLVGSAAKNHRFRRTVSIPEEYAKLFPLRPKPHEVTLPSCRASQLLVASSNSNYYVITPSAMFTRHSGTCRILGGAIHKQSV